MEDFQEVVYSSRNASWVALRRTRTTSMGEAEMLNAVQHWGEDGEGESKKNRSKPPKSSKTKKSKPDPFRRADDSRGESKN